MGKIGGVFFNHKKNKRDYKSGRSTVFPLAASTLIRVFFVIVRPVTAGAVFVQQYAIFGGRIFDFLRFQMVLQPLAEELNVCRLLNGLCGEKVPPGMGQHLGIDKGAEQGLAHFCKGR